MGVAFPTIKNQIGSVAILIELAVLLYFWGLATKVFVFSSSRAVLIFFGYPFGFLSGIILGLSGELSRNGTSILLMLTSVYVSYLLVCLMAVSKIKSDKS